MNRSERISILVIDDQDTVFELYEFYLGKKLGYHIDCIYMASEALHMVSETMYDIIICDAKLPYKGSTFGGLNLADELSLRCGINAILVVSQVVDADYVRNFDRNLHFLKKPLANEEGSVSRWFEHFLPNKIKTLLRRQYAFIAMPFECKELNDLYRDYIKKSIEESGFDVRRVDEIPFTKSITNKMFQKIREAHFVIFLTTGLNPNAFYEGGFALAIEKHIITCSDELSSLPFDIKDHRCIIYGNSKKEFSRQLKNLITEIRFYPNKDNEG